MAHDRPYRNQVSESRSILHLDPDRRQAKIMFKYEISCSSHWAVMV